MQRKWNLEESKSLIDLYKQNKSNKEISKILNRTANSISHKLHSLGLSRPLGTNQVSFGIPNPMIGREQSIITKQKIREKALERLKNKSNHPSWKGGRRINHNGYVCIRMPEHPRSVNGYIFEHILVMESILKRYLTDLERVHHLNGKRDDNRPENLMLFKDDTDHKRYHAFMRRKEVLGA